MTDYIVKNKDDEMVAYLRVDDFCAQHYPGSLMHEQLKKIASDIECDVCDLSYKKILKDNQ